MDSTEWLDHADLGGIGDRDRQSLSSGGSGRSAHSQESESSGAAATGKQPSASMNEEDTALVEFDISHLDGEILDSGTSAASSRSASSLDILADASQARRVATRRFSGSAEDGPEMSRKKPALTVRTARSAELGDASEMNPTLLPDEWAAKSEAMSPRQLETIVKGIATEKINVAKVS